MVSRYQRPLSSNHFFISIFSVNPPFFEWTFEFHHFVEPSGNANNMKSNWWFFCMGFFFVKVCDVFVSEWKNWRMKVSLFEIQLLLVWEKIGIRWCLLNKDYWWNKDKLYYTSGYKIIERIIDRTVAINLYVSTTSLFNIDKDLERISWIRIVWRWTRAAGELQFWFLNGFFKSVKDLTTNFFFHSYKAGAQLSRRDSFIFARFDFTFGSVFTWFSHI